MLDSFGNMCVQSSVKTKIFGLRLTPAEREVLDRQAEDEQMSRSRYIKWRLGLQPKPVRKRRRKERKEDE